MSRLPALILLPLLLPRPAAAKDGTPAERAQQIAAEAIEEYSAGRYEEALAGFGEARRIYPADPILVYYLARSHDKLHHVQRALARYEEYMDGGPLDENRAQVEEAIARLRSRVAEEALAEDPPPPPQARWRRPLLWAGVGAAVLATGVMMWTTTSLEGHREDMEAASAAGDHPTYLDAEELAQSDISTRRGAWVLMALAVPTVVLGYTW